jgi:broad specificity phosphatase PhoE
MKDFLIFAPNYNKLPSKKIYIIRHGQTDFNLRGIVQGSGVDSSLNDMGRAQALAFYESYRGISFDKIYTSSLKRTTESVEHFIREGIPHESFPGLNEISWGSKEGQRITPEEDAYYHWMLRQWELGATDLKIEQGESPNEVALRQKPVIDLMLSRSDESTILVCMHGRALRIILCQLLKYPLKSMDVFEHENLCLYQLNFTGTMMSVVKHNDTRHLDSVPGILSRPALISKAS